MTDKKLTYDPDYRVLPGWVLEERLAAMGLSCAEFAKKCELPQELIRGIIDGETPIELATAGRFRECARSWRGTLDEPGERLPSRLGPAPSSVERRTIL